MQNDSPTPETDAELYAKARAHMEKYSMAASLARPLWDAVVREHDRLERENAHQSAQLQQLGGRVEELEGHLLTMASLANKWLVQFTETVEGLDPEEKSEVDADLEAIWKARIAPLRPAQEQATKH